MTPLNAVSPTGFKYRGAAANVMRRMVAKTERNNLTIKPVVNNGPDREKTPFLYYVVRDPSKPDSHPTQEVTTLETPISGTNVVSVPKAETPPKKGFFGSLISSIWRMFR